MNNNKLTLISILGLVLALVLGGVAIVTAMRMSSQPSVSPTVPQSKPTASEITITPACGLTFTVAEIPALKCDGVAMVPSDSAIVGGSETRKLTATASGGMGSLKYSWVATGGTLSATTGQAVTWISPASFSSSQTFTVTATVSDDTGKTATSDSCKVSLGYTYNPSCNSSCQNSAGCPNDLACSSGRCRNPGCITQPGCTCPVATTPPPTVATQQTHKECRNYACVVVNGAGADTCTSDVSCKPAAIPPKIPESGVSLPTMLGIIGGMGLLFLGILVVL